MSDYEMVLRQLDGCRSKEELVEFAVYAIDRAESMRVSAKAYEAFIAERYGEDVLVEAMRDASLELMCRRPTWAVEDGR